MILELIENLRRVILWNTFCNSLCTVAAFVLLALYIKDTRWKNLWVVLLLVSPALAEENYKFLSVTSRVDRKLEPFTMNEVASHITDKDWRYVQYDQHGHDVDKITKTHEGTHMLDASLSTPGWQGIFIGNDHGIRLKIPDVRLDQVDIPMLERGAVYNTYMVRSREWWNDNVLYTLLEANGYLHGAKARAEMGWTNRSETIKYGIELTSYYARAIEAVEKHDPDYDTTTLMGMLDLLTAQWRVLAPGFEDWPLADVIAMHGKYYD